MAHFGALYTHYLGVSVLNISSSRSRLGREMRSVGRGLQGLVYIADDVWTCVRGELLDSSGTVIDRLRPRK